MSEDTSKSRVRQEQIERLSRRFQEHLKKSLPPDPSLTLDEMEQLAQQIGEQAKRDVQRVVGEPGTGCAGRDTACPCGKAARYVACYSKQLVTLCGARSLRPAYYYCGRCRRYCAVAAGTVAVAAGGFVPSTRFLASGAVSAV